MEKDLDLDNASIQELADQINTAISGVSNVEQVWRIAWHCILSFLVLFS